MLVRIIKPHLLADPLATHRALLLLTVETLVVLKTLLAAVPGRGRAAETSATLLRDARVSALGTHGCGGDVAGDVVLCFVWEVGVAG
jgi:hypothetical protein